MIKFTHQNTFRSFAKMILGYRMYNRCAWRTQMAPDRVFSRAQVGHDQSNAGTDCEVRNELRHALNRLPLFGLSPLY